MFETDTTLMPPLVSELPGILNWAIRGCLEWQRGGLQDPEGVKAATAEYRVEQNQFERFIAECCAEDPGAEIQASVLYQQYENWANQEGVPRQEWLSQTTFGKKAASRFEKVHRKTGWSYRGLMRIANA